MEWGHRHWSGTRTTRPMLRLLTPAPAPAPAPAHSAPRSLPLLPHLSLSFSLHLDAGSDTAVQSSIGVSHCVSSVALGVRDGNVLLHGPPIRAVAAVNTMEEAAAPLAIRGVSPPAPLQAHPRPRHTSAADAFAYIEGSSHPPGRHTHTHTPAASHYRKDASPSPQVSSVPHSRAGLHA